jgi:hypothetical protein
MECAELEAVAPELALGIADGAERAAALAHLVHCPRCRELVEDLGRVADDLLLLAPGSEPPLGFESRVVDRIAAAAPARTRRRPRLLVAAAAAVVVVAAGFGGLAAGLLRAGGAGGAAHVAELRSPEGTCHVVAIHGTPSELVVRLDEPGEGSSDYIVQAVPAHGGPPVALGSLHLRGGHGVLDATTASPVSAIRVMDANGVVRYRVAFPVV